MAKETAEEKLLKALQKSGSPLTSSAAKKVPSKKNLNLSFSIFDLNKILWLAVLICGAVLIFEWYAGMGWLSKEVNFSEEGKAPHREEVRIGETKGVKYYIDSLGNRNIFKPYDIALSKAAAGQPNLTKRLAKYKLVGVAWLDLPETASIMIEDTQTKTTYFLKIGEQLEGVTVKTIYTDRVVFSYENEEMTIKL